MTCTVHLKGLLQPLWFCAPLSPNWWWYCSASAENCTVLNTSPPLLVFHGCSNSALTTTSCFDHYWNVTAPVASVSLFIHFLQRRHVSGEQAGESPGWWLSRFPTACAPSGLGCGVERGELEVPVTVGQMMFFWAAHRNPTHLLPQCVWGWARAGVSLTLGAFALGWDLAWSLRTHKGKARRQQQRAVMN